MAVRQPTSRNIAAAFKAYYDAALRANPAEVERRKAEAADKTTKQAEALERVQGAWDKLEKLGIPSAMTHLRSGWKTPSVTSIGGGNYLTEC